MRPETAGLPRFLTGGINTLNGRLGYNNIHGRAGHLLRLFSATETAFSTSTAPGSRPTQTAATSARRMCSASPGSTTSCSPLLIGNNIVNIALSSIGTVLFIRHLGEDASASVATAVITVVVLIFGEISPKCLAKENPESFARFSAPLLRVFMWILTPLNFIFSMWKRLLSKLIRIKADHRMTQEELSVLVDEAGEEGGIDSDEVELLRSALEFTELEAGDILTPRVDLEAVPVDATSEEVAAAFRSSRFSRLPVFEGSIDNITGVVHQKDFYDSDGLGEGGLRAIMTTPVYVPPGTRISSLLKTLQRAKAHMAVVTDEYGGTLGIVTMEDILEELVGEIWDEHDEVVEELRQTGEDTYRVSGSAELDGVFEYFGIECESESVTLSGWVMEQLDRIPKAGDSFIRRAVLHGPVRIEPPRGRGGDKARRPAGRGRRLKSPAALSQAAGLAQSANKVSSTFSRWRVQGQSLSASHSAEPYCS
ncbi:MAG: hemolysin family protein [Oscillospiraceae bacterium]